MSEKQSSQSQVHVHCFGLLRVKHQKATINRRPGASTRKGGGHSSHPTPVTLYRNGQSMQNLHWFIKPTWPTATNFDILQTNSQ
jgi:hypothetical protein